MPVGAVAVWAHIALNSFKTATLTTVAECHCFMCIKVPRRLCKSLKCTSGTLLVPTLSLSLLAGWLQQPRVVFLTFRLPARSSTPFVAVPTRLGRSDYRQLPPLLIRIFFLLTAAAYPLSSKPVLLWHRCRRCKEFNHYRHIRRYFLATFQTLSAYSAASAHYIRFWRYHAYRFQTSALFAVALYLCQRLRGATPASHHCAVRLVPAQRLSFPNLTILSFSLGLFAGTRVA
jgi:hypothetical protein